MSMTLPVMSMTLPIMSILIMAARMKNADFSITALIHTMEVAATVTAKANHTSNEMCVL